MDYLTKGTQALRESVERGVEAVRASPLLATTYDIGERRYTLRRQVAQGGFATVFQGRDDRGGEWAVKRMLLHRQEARKARTEVALLKPLTHPNLVHLEAAAMWTRSTGEVEVALILEWCEKGSLSEHLWNRRNAPLAWDEVVAIIEQLASAVTYLHSLKPGLVHRDIKAENVLQHASGAWKLCDFGSATTVVLGPANTEAERAALELDVSQSTTEMLRAPEQVDLYRGAAIGAPVDMWAIGCVLFQLAVGRLPFDQRLGILNGAYRLPDDTRHPPCLAALLRDLLHQEPTRRATAPMLMRRLAAIKAGNTSFWQTEGTAPSPSPSNPPVASSLASVRSASPNPKPQATQQPVVTKVDLFAALEWVPTDPPRTASPSPNLTAALAPPSSQSPVAHQNGNQNGDPFATLDWMTASVAPPAASTSPVISASISTSTSNGTAAPSKSVSSPALFDFFDSAAPTPAATPAATATPVSGIASQLFDFSFAAAPPSSTVLKPSAPSGVPHATKSDSTADLYAAFTAPQPPSVANDLFAAVNAPLPPPPSASLPSSASSTSTFSIASNITVPVRKLSGDLFSGLTALSPSSTTSPIAVPAPASQPPAHTSDMFFFDALSSVAVPPPTSSASPVPARVATPPVPKTSAPPVTTARPLSPSPLATPTTPVADTMRAFPLLDNTPTSLPPDQICLLLSEVAYLRERVKRFEA